ncbi:MAG: hypothetical protein V4695_07240 [Pseudomonadota bacterium]
MSPDGNYFSTYQEYEAAVEQNFVQIRSIVDYYEQRPGVAYNGVVYADPYEIPPVVELYATNRQYATKVNDSYANYSPFAQDFISQFSYPGGTVSPYGFPPPGAGSYSSCGSYTWGEFQPAGGCTTSSGDLLTTLHDGSKYEGQASGVAYQRDYFGDVWAVTPDNSLPQGIGEKKVFDPANSFLNAQGQVMQGYPAGFSEGGGGGGSGTGQLSSGLASIAQSVDAVGIVSAIILIGAALAFVIVFVRFTRDLISIIRNG